jgi:hypothetical protein
MTLFPPRTPRRDEQQQRNQEPDRLKPCYRIEADAVVSADAHETPAQDELRASAGARWEPVPLPHPWRGSSNCGLAARLDAPDWWMAI